MKFKFRQFSNVIYRRMMTYALILEQSFFLALLTKIVLKIYATHSRILWRKECSPNAIARKTSARPPSRLFLSPSN